MKQDYQIIFPDDVIERLLVWYDNDEHHDEFDMKSLFNKALASLSLGISDKFRVIDSVPELSLSQLQALEEVFDEERDKFLELLLKHPKDITILLGQQIFQSVLLMVYLDVIDNNEQKQTTIHYVLTQLADNNVDIWETAQYLSENGHVYWQYLFRQLQEYQHFVSSENQDFERLLNGKF